MSRETVCRALTKAAWAQIFLHINFNLGTLNLLPNWAGYVLLWGAIALLCGSIRDLALLRPFCLLLGGWDLLTWVLALIGFPPSAYGPLYLPALLATVVGIYFHFQLFTAFADLAAAPPVCDPGLAARMRVCRSVSAVLTTLAMLPLPWARWTVPFAVLVLSNFCFTLAAMHALFRLRRALRD